MSSSIYTHLYKTFTSLCQRHIQSTDVTVGMMLSQWALQTWSGISQYIFFPHVNIITFSVNISHSMPQWRRLIVTQPSDDETHIYPSVHANQHDTHANSSPERLWFLFLGHLKLPSVHVPGISNLSGLNNTGRTKLFVKVALHNATSAWLEIWGTQSLKKITEQVTNCTMENITSSKKSTIICNLV